MQLLSDQFLDNNFLARYGTSFSEQNENFYVKLIVVPGFKIEDNIYKTIKSINTY